MRRGRVIVVGTFVGWLIALGGGSSSASCPSGDGTIPGTGSSVTAIGTGDATPYTTVYLDDRDLADLDNDGQAESVWIYLESNGTAGLQRGGYQVVEPVLRQLPMVYVPPTQVLPPDSQRPVLPNGLTLFPSPGPYPVWEGLISYDDCRTDQNGESWSGPPDTLLF